MSETNEAEYLSANEAAKILGVAKRTIQLYGQQGKIVTAAGIDSRNQACVLYHAGDLERFRFERAQPPKKRDVVLSERKPARKPDALQTTQGAMIPQVGTIENTAPPATRPWMALDEAERHSGLSRKLLLELIRTGKLPALEDRVKADRWRIHREDLEALRGVRL